MKHLRKDFLYPVILLLIWQAACGPATATTVSNTGPLGLKPTPTPTYAPPLISVPLGVKPACDPPVPSISKVNSFCASFAAGQGGVTFYGPASYNWASTPNDSCDFSNIPKVTCTGPQNTKFPVVICQSCGLPQPQALGPFVCSNGYVDDGTGTCINPNPQDGVNWFACPPGSHYDNGLQNCADDVTNALASPCPPDHPYYIPDFHYCLANASPVVYDCQTFNLQLGDCSLQQNKPKVKGCGDYTSQADCPSSCRWTSGSCHTP